MNNPNFTSAISVAQSPQEAFNAINNVRGWWSEEIEGSTDKLGDEFTYRYEDIHRCRMKVIELIADRKVVWLVLDNYFNFTEDKSEWTGTRIVFDVSEKGDQTEIRSLDLLDGVDRVLSYWPLRSATSRFPTS
jgi:hypothetical protein